MPSAFSCASSGAARSRLAANTSDDFGVTLSMRGLRFRSPGFENLVDVVALPAGFLVVDLHVERQRELAAGEDRIEMAGEDLEDMLAGPLAGREVAPFAEPQHHGEKPEMRIAVGDRVMFAPECANANPPERKNPGFHRGLADELDDLAHVQALIEIGGIFDREMRHGFCFAP